MLITSIIFMGKHHHDNSLKLSFWYMINTFSGQWAHISVSNITKVYVPKYVHLETM
jgi:hypothetical protein